MPSTYAHRRFGANVLDHLPAPLREKLEAHRELYDIGLHGPDLLFYYHAEKSTTVAALGNAMHDEPGRTFFDRARRVVHEEADREAALAYALGFVCHFALDSTCHPFVAENAMGEAWNEKLRKAGGEYGAATGRPRRVGPFDCVASRYGLQCQGSDKIALTKLDVLSSMKQIPVITGYKLDGVEVPRFDTLSDLDRVQPVVTLLPGWNKDISGCRSWAELPKEAKAYDRNKRRGGRCPHPA